MKRVLVGMTGASGATYGVDFLRSSGQTVFTETLRDRFDIVGFDPRGVGASDPVTCLNGSAMDRLNALAQRRELRVIEDAAHAIGSRLGDRAIGSFGDLVCFSFHANKNITTIEGGAIVGGSPQEVAAIERLRFHGLLKRSPDEFEVEVPSGKANLPDVNAAIGLAQLQRLPEFNDKRRLLVARYFDCFRDQPLLRLPARGDEGHSWHIFAPLLPVGAHTVSRLAFIDAMATRGVGVGVHYPAVHLFAAYRALGYREGQFPNAERIGAETVTLPLFPQMTFEDVDRVFEATLDALAEVHS